MNPSGQVEWEVNGTPLAYIAIYTVAALSLGKWQHVAATFDSATQAIAIYVNGVQVPSSIDPLSSTVASIFQSAIPATIGTFYSGQDFWAGLIDEVELFNRVLPASEIQAIYNAGSAGKCKTGGSPVLLSVSPNSGQQGQLNLPVTIAGQFTNWVQGTTTAGFGTGITVASLTVNSPSIATAELNIDPAAPAGARTVTMTTGSEVETLANGFTVTAGTPTPREADSLIFSVLNGTPEPGSTSPTSREADSLTFSVLSGTPAPGSTGPSSREADSLIFSVLNGTPEPGSTSLTSREADSLTFSVLNGEPPVPAQPVVFEADSLTFSVLNAAPRASLPARRAGSKGEIGSQVMQVRDLRTEEAGMFSNDRRGPVEKHVRVTEGNSLLKRVVTALTQSIRRVRIPIQSALRITSKQRPEDPRLGVSVAAMADPAGSAAESDSRHESKCGEATRAGRSRPELR